MITFPTSNLLFTNVELLRQKWIVWKATSPGREPMSSGLQSSTLPIVSGKETILWRCLMRLLYIICKVLYKGSHCPLESFIVTVELFRQWKYTIQEFLVTVEQFRQWQGMPESDTRTKFLDYADVELSCSMARWKKNIIYSEIKDFDSAIEFILHQKGIPWRDI